MTRGTALSGALVLVTLPAISCVEREEAITVAPDGSASIKVRFASDSFQELYTGDAVPALDQGWLVEDWVERDEEDKETFRLEAEQWFADARLLPDRYGSIKDPYADVVLHFPTTLEIQARRDGTYGHFRRVYPSRPWASLDSSRRTIEEKIKEAVGGRELEDLGEGERLAILKALGRFEVMKFTSFARAAFLDVSPEAPQDLWLRVYASLQGLENELDYQPVLELLLAEEGAEPEADEALRRFTETFQKTALERIERALSDGERYSTARLNQFRHRFEQHRTFYDITEDLGDERFTITLTMPGVIVGHNGDSVSGCDVTWEFDGTRFRDAPLELMASSRIR